MEINGLIEKRFLTEVEKRKRNYNNTELDYKSFRKGFLRVTERLMNGVIKLKFRAKISEFSGNTTRVQLLAILAKNYSIDIKEVLNFSCAAQFFLVSLFCFFVPNLWSCLGFVKFMVLPSRLLNIYDVIWLVLQYTATF